MKGFKGKEQEIFALTVIAEEDECEWEWEVLHVEECEGFKKEEVVQVLSEFSDVLSEILGKQRSSR